MSASTTGVTSSSGSREVELSIRGMTCAACAARVEKKLSALDDVVAAVNFATGKALVTTSASVPVARLIEAVEEAGYDADLARLPAGPGGTDEAGPEAARVAYLRRRLIVALVFFVPLSDLSVLLSLRRGRSWACCRRLTGSCRCRAWGRAAMAASSVFVVASSVRLRRFGLTGPPSPRPPRRGEPQEAQQEAQSCPA